MNISRSRTVLALAVMAILMVSAAAACSSSAGSSTATTVAASPTTVSESTTTAVVEQDATKDAKVTGCLASSGGHGGISTVQVTNPTKKAATYHVDVSFATPSGNRFGDGVGAFQNVPAGKSKTIPIISPAVKANITKVVCSIISVKRAAA